MDITEAKQAIERLVNLPPQVEHNVNIQVDLKAALDEIKRLKEGGKNLYSITLEEVQADVINLFNEFARLRINGFDELFKETFEEAERRNEAVDEEKINALYVRVGEMAVQYERIREEIRAALESGNIDGINEKFAEADSIQNPTFNEFKACLPSEAAEGPEPEGRFTWARRRPR